MPTAFGGENVESTSQILTCRTSIVSFLDQILSRAIQLPLDIFGVLLVRGRLAKRLCKPVVGRFYLSLDGLQVGLEVVDEVVLRFELSSQVEDFRDE